MNAWTEDDYRHVAGQRLSHVICLNNGFLPLRKWTRAHHLWWEALLKDASLPLFAFLRAQRFLQGQSLTYREDFSKSLSILQLFWCFISYADSCTTSWWFLNCRGYVALKDDCEGWIENDMRGKSVSRFGVGLGKGSARVTVPFLCGRVWNMEDSWPLKTGPISCPELSVRNYHHSLSNSAEEGSSHLLVTFPRQKWLRKRGLTLRYTFITSLYTE